jgi:pimeloyl-ACP methyl ester carboxylesterase
MATADGFIHTVAQGIEAMPEGDLSAFTRDFAASWLTPYDLPADQAIVTVDATALAAGAAPGPVSSTVNLDAVDGLSTSTRIPPIATSQEDWRQTMEGLQANPPGNIEDLESEIIRLSDGVTQNEIEELKTRDPNALPALLNSLLPHPDIDLSTDLRLQFAGTGGPDDPENYYSMSFESGVVVVETSLDKLLGDQADLDATYGVGDIPMTIRIPFAAGADVDWNNPRPEDLEALNGQVSTIGSTTLFLHGYQSNREVWAADMQTWMDAAAGDTIGISMAGMGSEGHFLGNGDSPLTPRQYGFHTLEALDRMGLFGKELNVVGHSMGGAAALQMGLAIESLTADGRPRPDVRYVLAEPAPAGDSVPFLTDYRLGGSYVLGASNWIGIQNWAGTTGFGPLEWVAEQGNHLLGGGIVNDLMPDAPEAVRNVHAHFADGAGFEQLEATALGLTSQQEPDPEAVAAFLARNPVLVLAGDADRIVGSPVVEGIFGGASVVPIVGGHYAHLTDPAALDAVRSLFSLSFRPQVPGGGGGVHTLR